MDMISFGSLALMIPSPSKSIENVVSLESKLRVPVLLTPLTSVKLKINCFPFKLLTPATSISFVETVA